MLPNPVGLYYWEDGGERHTCHGVGGPALWPKWSEETKSFADIYVHDRRGPPGHLRRLQKEEIWMLQGRHPSDFKVLGGEHEVDRMIDEGCRATGGQTAANLLAGAGALVSKAIEQEAGKAGASSDQMGAEALAQILLWLRRWRRGDFGKPFDHRKAGAEAEREDVCSAGSRHGGLACWSRRNRMRMTIARQEVVGGQHRKSQNKWRRRLSTTPASRFDLSAVRLEKESRSGLKRT